MFLVRDDITDMTDSPPRPEVRHTMVANLDPFAPPAARTRIAAARHRQQVAITGTVTAVGPVRWAGGDVLEVTLEDATGTMTLAFLGRRQVAGVELGRRLTAGGTVGRRDGRPVILNPLVWLTPLTTVTAARQPA
jgi:hypothetical protein